MRDLYNKTHILCLRVWFLCANKYIRLSSIKKIRGERWGFVAPPGERGYNGRQSAIQDRVGRAEVTALQRDLWARGLGEAGALELMTIRSVCGENTHWPAGETTNTLFA